MMYKQLASIFLAAAPVFADAPLDPVFHPIRAQEKQPSAPKDLPRESQKNRQEVFFICDLLVWDSREEGLEYAYKNTKTQSNQELRSFEPESKFEPGFRVGCGGFLPHDEWILGALYTYYSTNRKDSASHDFDVSGSPGPGMISVWTYPSAFLNNNTAARFETAHNHWKLHTSFLDLSLGRECAIGSQFKIVPTFGVRAAWIHQRYEVDYNEGNAIVPSMGTPISILSSSINMNCASNLVGPFFGCGTNWRLGHGWNLFSNTSGAILASHFHIGRGETDLFLNNAGTLQTESIRLHNEYWTFRPQAQITLGFRFVDTVSYGSRPIQYSFSAAYEAQIWWRQNGLLRYIDTLNSTSSGAYVASTQGDLMFHGVNIEAGVQF